MRHRLLIAFLSSLICITDLSSTAQAADLSKQVLAFYYGWYGNPRVSGEWRHWKNVDPVAKRIENVTDFRHGAPMTAMTRPWWTGRWRRRAPSG